MEPSGTSNPRLLLRATSPLADAHHGSVTNGPGAIFSPPDSASTGFSIASEWPTYGLELDNMYAGPWLEIHHNFAAYVLHTLRLCDSPRNELIELSKQWAGWDVLTSLANYQYVVDMLFKCLEVIKSSPQSGPVIAEEISQQLSRDVSVVLNQMVSVLKNAETYKGFLTHRDTRAQQLLDLVQDLLDFACDSASRPLLSQALLRLSRVSGLHPTCFVLPGLEKVGHQVAGGGFGDIWKGLIGGQVVAVKSMRIFENVEVKTALKEFGREAVIWRQFYHPNLLPFFGLYYLDTRLCLVSPWMEHGHLLQFLRNAPSTFDRVPLVGIFWLVYILDVSMGLEYLHANRVVHGDLKAMNVLVTPSNRACIADFGLSAIAEEMSLRFTHSTPIPRGGTVRYQGPELLSSKSAIHFGSDVYAFACVCYEIFTAKSPFFDVANEMAVAINVINGHRPSRPETLSQDTLWVLIEDCWKQEPDKRPTATEITQRLVSPLIGATTAGSDTDWDEKYSARFRRSVQQWPLLPSVAKIQGRIFGEGLFSSITTVI
ncbi:kinase-like domain-containing protein [Mycena epipterygia]|nr:kinase-like domain-containing protein [Mycena epipterygia]